MINVHIERVVLDQVPVSAGERSLFQATIETELKRLLRIHGLSDELRKGVALAHVRTGAVQIGKEGGPVKLGADVAGAVHQGLAHHSRTQPSIAKRRSAARLHVSTFGGNHYE